MPRKINDSEFDQYAEKLIGKIIEWNFIKNHK